MSSDRYYVDERGGCIAVVDRTAEDPSDAGLRADKMGVAWYEHGVMVDHCCEHCGHRKSYTWDLKTGARERANAECDRLNKQATPPSTRCT